MVMPRRLLTIVGAYIAASVVAGVVLAAGILSQPGGQVGPIDLDFLQITAFFLAFVSGLVAVLALPPAIAVSWYAESRGKRSALFYGSAGALVSLVALGVFAALLAWNNTSGEPSTSTGGAAGVAAAIAVVAGFFVVAGVAGGLTYWAIAGRTAGSQPVTPVAS